MQSTIQGKNAALDHRFPQQQNCHKGDSSSAFEKAM